MERRGYDRHVPDEPPDAPVGLRERKRARTRTAVLRAAAAVFDEQGYEATTIDAIAERADISPRTVFRYFGTKEDMALAELADFYGALVDQLAIRAPDEPPLAALAGATHAAWSRPAGVDTDAFNALLRLCEESTTLLAALLRLAEEHERALVAELVRRGGDERAMRVIAAAYLATLRIATDEWHHGSDTSTRALREALDRCLAQLRENAL